MRLVGNAFVRITPFKDFRVELLLRLIIMIWMEMIISTLVQPVVGRREKDKTLRGA